jgi:predicted dehydrogenase
MEKLRIAVVGLGLMGKKHIELVKANKNCILAAIVAPKLLENLNVAKENKMQLFPNISKMLRENKIDGIIIASPNKFHIPQAIECVKHNIPVLIEKPVSHSLKEGLKLDKIAKTKNAKILIGHHRSYNSIIKQAKKIISSNLLGKIVTLNGFATFYKPNDYFKAGPWRKNIGGGPVLINMVHEISNLRELCGEITHVQAILSNDIRKFKVEDTGVFNFKFLNGTLATFNLSDTVGSIRSWEHTSGENKIYPFFQDESCYIISGTNGTMSIPNFSIKIYDQKKEKSWLKRPNSKIINVKKIDPFKKQLDHFVKVIKGKEIPNVSLFDGLQNIKIIEAIYKSAKNGKLIHVD